MIAIGTHASVERAEYDAMPHLNYSLAKEMAKSPRHFAHWQKYPHKDSPALKLGGISHWALLEPEKFKNNVAVWDSRTDSGNLRPRNGKRWDDFEAAHAGQVIVTQEEKDRAEAIRDAVMAEPEARRLIEGGQSEVTGIGKLLGIDCKSRFDVLGDYLAEIKTTRHAQRQAIQNHGAKLHYHAQFGWYHDLLEAATGEARPVRVVAIESEPPYCVAVFEVDADALADGRRVYEGWLRLFLECQESGRWPGPAGGVLRWEVPVWASGIAFDEEAEDAVAA